MTVDPLQSISDSMSQSTQNPNPNQPNTNASIPIPPQTTTAAHPNTSTPIPKNPSSLIPSAPSKSNPHQKAAETRSQAQLNPGQIRKDSTSLPKGTASAPKVPKTVNILNTETGTTAVPEPAALKIKARTMLLAKAIKAQEDGDDDKADRFFEMHNILLKEETVERDGKEFISDISDYKPDTADDAHSEARNFNEIGLRDNPYALGGPRYGWDPHTGQKINKPNAPQASSTKSAPLPSQPNPSPYSSSQSPSHPSQPPNHLPLKPGGQDQSQGRPPRGSGYKGKNYNPNHGSGFKKRD
ncbi:hypothetical protein PGTUg99_027398 [Puccinia graminis f. sp. tritici]|uniref:Uncharacterized protein n=1 Tax=Puccinia graminis f. sp. tritici TaxID=56615 RepID=A0A5B0RVD4_PUCGR|nr:hypothetical protein PGTUg99_027398 [Puccinia graminis f. sp. tritici]